MKHILLRGLIGASAFLGVATIALLITDGPTGFIEYIRQAPSGDWFQIGLMGVGAFVAGAFNGLVKVPVYLLAFGMFLVLLVPVGLLVLFMDTAPTTGLAAQVWFVPLLITSAYALPTFLFWLPKMIRRFTSLTR
jgi:hypothetical protein